MGKEVLSVDVCLCVCVEISMSINIYVMYMYMRIGIYNYIYIMWICTYMHTYVYIIYTPWIYMCVRVCVQITYIYYEILFSHKKLAIFNKMDGLRRYNDH